MLIPSPRHRREDVATWESLVVADYVHAETDGFRRRVAEASAVVVRFVDGRRSVYAGTSWGKDSTVLVHLLWSVASAVPVMHLRPTNHNPDCDRVRDTYRAMCPGQSYVEVAVDYRGIDRRRLPHQEVNRQTDQRWYAAIREFEASYPEGHLLGIRQDESMGRRFRVMRWGLESPNACAPLGRWSTQDVFAYLARHDLPVHPAYAMLGGGRWPRERLRVAEIGDTHGTGSGRAEWEREYYGDVLRRLESG